MAVGYNSVAGTITITDAIGNRPPIVLGSTASAGEIEATIVLYHPAIPPDPQWVAFGGAVQSSTAINQLLGVALQQAPALGLGLGVGLGKAADGDARVFLSSWAIARSLNLISAELLAEVTALAGQFSLPSEFVAALQPA
jgi:hypothetical protein